MNEKERQLAIAILDAGLDDVERNTRITGEREKFFEAQAAVKQLKKILTGWNPEDEQG
jgi:hypothetical protein